MYLVQKVPLLHNTGPSSGKFCVEIFTGTLSPQKNGARNEHPSSLNAERILNPIPWDLGYMFVFPSFF